MGPPLVEGVQRGAKVGTDLDLDQCTVVAIAEPLGDNAQAPFPCWLLWGISSCLPDNRGESCKLRLRADNHRGSALCSSAQQTFNASCIIVHLQEMR